MSLPETPHTRRNLYLSVIAGQNSVDDLPDNPLTEEERYLDYIARNGGGGGSAGISVSLYRYGDLVKKEAVASGTVITLPSVKSYTDWEFAGWSATKGATTAPDYEAGDTITVTADVSLYAVFGKVIRRDPVYELDHSDSYVFNTVSNKTSRNKILSHEFNAGNYGKIEFTAECDCQQHIQGHPPAHSIYTVTSNKFVDDETKLTTSYDPYAIGIYITEGTYIKPAIVYNTNNETITVKAHDYYASASSSSGLAPRWAVYTVTANYYNIAGYTPVYGSYTQEFHSMTIKSFTYTGTGSVPNQITFPETPSMVMGISSAFERSGNEVAQGCVPFVWGEKAMYMYWSNSNGSESAAGSHYTHLSYNGNVLTISIAGSDGGAVMNIANETYTVYYV